MSRNEIILGVVALVLVGFSLIVSLWVPRRRPDFPAERIGLFAAVAILLVVAMLGTVELFGAEEEEDEGEVAAETQGPAETGATGGETGGAETGGAETGGGGADVAQGKDLFASSGCGGCHTLADAGTTGTTGPNLDDLKPGMDAAVEQITNGGGGMPPFGGQLSEAEIDAVAAYVVSATQ